MYNMEDNVYTAKYAEIIAKHPILTAEQEKEWLAKFSKSSGARKEKARDVLFCSNLSYVLKCAHHFFCKGISSNSGITFEDLVNSGCEGLSIALNHYDFSTGNRLTTYATAWINKYILDYITANSSLVYISSHIVNLQRKYNKMLQNNVSISDKEARKELHISQKSLVKTKAAKVTLLYLDKEVGESDREDSNKPLIEFLKDEKAENPLEVIARQERCEALHNILNTLDPISRDILVSRFLKDKSSLKDIGKKYGICSERVRQIEWKALKILRKRIKIKKEHLFLI